MATIQRDWSGTAKLEWDGTAKIDSVQYQCGYCDARVAPDRGYITKSGGAAKVRLCPQCNRPTFFDAQGGKNPGQRPGQHVDRLPDDVGALYTEARSCVAASAYSAAILVCRKIVMHVAVEKGAEPGKRFVNYVSYIVDEHHVPVGSKPWVDFIRSRSNEENHEIRVATQGDAEGVLRFVAQLLTNVYELPGSIPETPAESD